MVFLMSFLCASVLAELKLQSSHTESSTAGRIVGGEEVPYQSSWPWQVQHHIDNM